MNTASGQLFGTTSPHNLRSRTGLSREDIRIVAEFSSVETPLPRLKPVLRKSGIRLQANIDLPRQGSKSSDRWKAGQRGCASIKTATIGEVGWRLRRLPAAELHSSIAFITRRHRRLNKIDGALAIQADSQTEPGKALIFCTRTLRRRMSA